MVDSKLSSKQRYLFDTRLVSNDFEEALKNKMMT